jgi:V/A-type H+/Na+-transporting ATPase subunit I
MPSADVALPARMSRVAIVAPRRRARRTLVELAREGCVELAGALPAADGEAVEALRRLAGTDSPPVRAALAADEPDVRTLEREGSQDLIAGEVELDRRARLALEHGSFVAWVGWAPAEAVEQLNERLAGIGAVAVELPRPAWVEPPTWFRPVAVRSSFEPLVSSYGTARYGDIDPTLFTAVSFVVMFGMMFGDVGHGLVLAALALCLRLRRVGRLAAFRHLWPIPFAAGLTAAAFGLLYGECFGPTGLVPTLWLSPLEEPVRLLLVAVGVGAVLLAISYLLGIVNRWRESGFGAALFDQSGISGFAIFVGVAVFAGGYYWDLTAAEVVGVVLAGTGAVLLGAGLALRAGRGAAALTQAGVELVDALVRLASNLISFSRLAAFGLMHAAIGAVVWDATTALWGGVLGAILAVVVFVVGNALAFALEALVAGVQALRLEYYELFSRVFAGEGRPFRPWTLPVLTTEEAR